MDSLPTLDPVHIDKPLKSSFSTVSPNLPDILPTTISHKRQPKKRVRFALKLDPVDEESAPPSREISFSATSQLNKRVIDPWRQHRPLYGAYFEYLEKQDRLPNIENEIRHVPPPVPPPPPEPGTAPPTYTHTFIIQSKSPDLVIDSITISTPPHNLPRIIHRNKKPVEQQLSSIDTLFKQPLKISTPPRMTHTRKETNISNQKNHDTLVNTALKRVEVNTPSTNGLQPNNKLIRRDNLFTSKYINDHVQTKKITEPSTKSLSGANNQVYHFPERPILPNYSRNPAMPNHTHRTYEKSNMKTCHFYENRDNDYLFQPIIHSTH
ncbi:unnamed protein product [Rotaria sp. Silwood2]|nr:unnamed protein product [Rotaria sp. Silwood2]CAF2479120.1 unnamed protein product [Rotaria sp. Silwood2]CAF2713055.1 unnamed protein product [Rotaria sp. Silwood2]CAF2863276.1 unnamed protein product [Rotaria sp. Silwood2]CAF4417508.1 unnamed protein product [Rotaria sp. Silwood2]